MRKFLLTAFIALALQAFLGLPALAGDDACLRRTVSVTAADRDWAPILGLRAEDFHGEFRGKPVKILSIVPDEHPHRIVIALDASGTMSGAREWEFARRLASHLAESDLKEASYGLLVFNDKVQEQIDFSHGAGAVAKRLQEIQADPGFRKTMVHGKTALWDALASGSKVFQNSDSGNFFYVITDGRDNASHTKPEAARQILAVSRARMFVVLIADPLLENRLKTPEEEWGPRDLSEMARATGGATFGPLTLDGSGRAYATGDVNRKSVTFEDIDRSYKTMVSEYRMEIELPGTTDKWQDWKLEITKEKQKQFKDSQLGYTRDLAPCSESLK